MLRKHPLNTEPLIRINLSDLYKKLMFYNQLNKWNSLPEIPRYVLLLCVVWCCMVSAIEKAPVLFDHAYLGD